MSNMTRSQMEAVLLDRIEKTKIKLEQLQQKHKLEIGTLAYKHHLHLLTLQELESAFAKISLEANHA